MSEQIRCDEEVPHFSFYLLALKLADGQGLWCSQLRDALALF
jgi:hypothetical protein